MLRGQLGSQAELSTPSEPLLQHPRRLPGRPHPGLQPGHLRRQQRVRLLLRHAEAAGQRDRGVLCTRCVSLRSRVFLSAASLHLRKVRVCDTAPAVPTAPASCATLMEFMAIAQTVTTTCCTAGVECPPGGIPSRCTPECEEVLLPMQVRPHLLRVRCLSCTTFLYVSHVQ